MNKSELIEHIAKQADISKAAAARALEAVIGGVKSTLKKNNSVSLVGFGTFSVGKRVRTETGLGEGAVSVSYAAIALARKIFRDLKGLHVLILGAGEMAKLTGTHLKAQAVK